MKKITGKVMLRIPAAQADSSPMVAALAKTGVNVEAFAQRFNEVTESLRGQIVRATVTVYKDHSFAIGI